MLCVIVFSYVILLYNLQSVFMYLICPSCKCCDLCYFMSFTATGNLKVRGVTKVVHLGFRWCDSEFHCIPDCLVPCGICSFQNLSLAFPIVLSWGDKQGMLSFAKWIESVPSFIRHCALGDGVVAFQANLPSAVGACRTGTCLSAGCSTSNLASC